MNIYGICDPVTDELKYVGCTKHDLKHRLDRHLSVARYRKTKGFMVEWLKSLDSKGLKPSIFLIEETNDPVDEGFYIEYFTSVGCDLLNEMTPGADGCRRHRSVNLRDSASMKGMNVGLKRPREVVERIAAKLRGRIRPPMSVEWRQKIGDAHRGRTLPEEHRLHIAEGVRKTWRQYH